MGVETPMVNNVYLRYVPVSKAITCYFLIVFLLSYKIDDANTCNTYQKCKRNPYFVPNAISRHIHKQLCNRPVASG